MQKLKLQTADMAERNIETLGQLFPSCLTEKINDEGKLVKAIDFDKLRQELACEIVEGAEERYQFTWPDKRNAIRLANSPINKTLRPCREESVDFDNTENLYIEGDNLEVLKLLRENYLGKVKMIYIDPPYNTGNDFVYNDDFAQGVAEFNAQSGLFDEEGRRMADPMVQNTESNGRFHTDWLNMIYPRLKVAKDLLADDGVIFISIDDNEVENLRKVCDEVFGRFNFLATVVWQKKYAATNDSKGFSTTHDYIVVYQKSTQFNRNLLPRTAEQNAPYKHDDNDGKGLWRSDNLLVKSFSESGVYPIVNPNTGVEYYPPKGSCWRACRETMNIWLAENRIFFGKDGKGAPQLKRYLNEVQQGRVPITWWSFEEVGHNDEANKEVSALFGSKTPFDTPKPVRLLSQMLRIGANSDSLILDFFSGSATTAHSVMHLNAEDGGNRKFIMVQIPEKTDEKSEAYKAGYKNICEIGKERIRRAGKKVKEEAGSSAQNLDTGFRVLKLDSSNMANVMFTPSEMPVELSLFDEVLESMAENIKEDRTPEDLLFQVMPMCNLPLSSKIEELEIHGKKVFAVNDNFLVACFDNDINEDVITTIAKMKPYYFIMRDSSAANDNVVDNFEQIFEAYSKDTVRRIL